MNFKAGLKDLANRKKCLASAKIRTQGRPAPGTIHTIWTV